MMAAPTGSVYFSLRRPQQRRIDAAFKKTFTSITPTTSKSGAGFLVDEPVVDLGCQIPFDLVPETLEFLGLPSNDPEVLYVFKNAAEGWKSSQEAGSLKPQLGVSLEDWRSVCAILLENEDEDEGASDRDDENPDEDEGDEDEDMYKDESSEEPSDVDDEDFDVGPRIRRTRGQRQRQTSRSSSPSPTPPPSKLTPRQIQSCLDTYALFFPDTPSTSLKTQRLMISDIQGAANLIKEKRKAEEIIDMLEMFSTSADKSMSFQDFTRMLVTAKLV